MEEAKQPLTEEQAKAIEQSERAKAEMIHRAYRSHTRWLFWLWLILVVFISWSGLNLLSKVKEPSSGFIALGFTFWLILFTGGYVFQEVRKVHRRIDGLLNLIDKK